MKNVMKALGMAVLFSGVVAVANAQTTPAQTPAKSTTTTKPMTKNMDKVIGTDAKGNKVYKGEKGNYYLDAKGNKVMEPKDAKITPVSTTPTKSK